MTNNSDSYQKFLHFLPTALPVKKRAQSGHEPLSEVRVLLADRDLRTAQLVQRILASFGFRKIELVTNGDAALERLRNQPYDLIITEWQMTPTDGVSLIKEIRRPSVSQQVRTDVPIIMLTARSETDHVVEARDAGINGFITKPFTAKTISNRLLSVIDKPRGFVHAASYVGPCRRNRGALPPGVAERRGRSGAPTRPLAPANTEIRDRLGSNILYLFGEEAVAQAQHEIENTTADFIAWAKDDIELLQLAYEGLKAGKPLAQQALFDAAYSIKSQAGIFGYSLGTTIAGMLMDYLGSRSSMEEERLTVIRKHIDAIAVIFNQQIKNHGQVIGRELIHSLQILTKKLG